MALLHLKRKGFIPVLWLITALLLGGYTYWKFYLRPKLNIILITVDTVRQDHLSYAGYERKTSPNIDKLASQGVVFMQATNFSNWTMPSHENLLTGRYPISSIIKQVSPSSTFISEILNKWGYYTAAFISGIWCQRKFGFNQGFDFFDDNFEGERYLSASYGDLLNLLDTKLQQPFFLWIYLLEPHFPYDAHDQFEFGPGRPTEYDKYNTYFGTKEEMSVLWKNQLGLGEKDLQRARDLYDGEILYTDSYLGRLWEDLKKRGLFDKSLIILTSDHGEGFGEHGWFFSHGYDLTEEITRVPLIIKMPGNSPRGKIVEAQVQTSDVFATILDAAGFHYESSITSKSLLPLIKGKEEKVRDYAYSYSFNPQRYSVRNGRYKLIYSDKTKEYDLYDLASDPWEEADIKEKRTEIADEMKKELDSFVKGFSQFKASHTGVAPPKIDEETRKRLMALGYIH